MFEEVPEMKSLTLHKFKREMEERDFKTETVSIIQLHYENVY